MITAGLPSGCVLQTTAMDTTTSNTMDTTTTTNNNTMDTTTSNSDSNGDSIVKGALGTKGILRDCSEEVVIRLPTDDLVEEEVLSQEENLRGTRDGWFVVAREVRKERSTVRKRQTVSFHDVVEETVKQDKQDRQSTNSDGVWPPEGT